MSAHLSGTGRTPLGYGDHGQAVGTMGYHVPGWLIRHISAVGLACRSSLRDHSSWVYRQSILEFPYFTLDFPDVERHTTHDVIVVANF